MFYDLRTSHHCIIFIYLFKLGQNTIVVNIKMKTLSMTITSQTKLRVETLHHVLNLFQRRQKCSIYVTKKGNKIKHLM